MSRPEHIAPPEIVSFYIYVYMFMNLSVTKTVKQIYDELLGTKNL